MSNEIKITSQLLFNEEPLVVNRLAAKVIGLNESIVIQQVHYWLEINRKAKINFHDGKTWSYNTYEKWQVENFDFWSVRTVRRVFTNLFDKGILIKGNYNLHKYDRKLWVTIDYDKLDDLLTEYNNKNVENIEIPTEGQNGHMSNSNMCPNWPDGKGQVGHIQEDNLSSPIAETTTEISTEISFTTQQTEDKPLVVETDELIKLIESNTHLLLDSKNKRDKVSKWNKDRLLKAIEIFKQREGQYFTLLEKIYKDDKNFAPVIKGSSSPTVKTRFHNINESFRNYTPEELTKLIKENQKDKFNKTDNNQSIDMNAIREKAIDILQERINADSTIVFKQTVRWNLKAFENEINEICNELLNNSEI